MKVLIEIDEGLIDSLKNGSFGIRYNTYDLCGVVANGTPLNGTNGEVIKAVFPNVVIVHKIRENKREIVFSDDCWNAEYKGVE